MTQKEYDGMLASMYRIDDQIDELFVESKMAGRHSKNKSKIHQLRHARTAICNTLTPHQSQFANPTTERFL